MCLTGSGESGKSTFIKQLKIIKGSGFEEHLRGEFVLVIRSNLLQACRSILSAMAVLYIEFESPVCFLLFVVLSLDHLFLSMISCRQAAYQLSKCCPPFSRKPF